jgi:hypothetical protein
MGARIGASAAKTCPPIKRALPTPPQLARYRLSRTSAPVAQLDRAPDYESGGRAFESLRAHQFSDCIEIERPLFRARLRVMARSNRSGSFAH